MAVSLKHAFTSNVADSGDPNLVQPSNWNAEHTLTAGADTLLGAISAGSVVEIPCTAAGRAILDDADAAAQRTTLGLGTGDSPTFTGLTLSGVGSFSAGTELLPSITTTGDTNTGMWFPAADTVAWSTGGTERMRIGSTGNVGIGTNAPSNLLSVYNAGIAAFSLSSDLASSVVVDRASNNVFSSSLQMRKYRGTIASPLAVSSGDISGSITSSAYDGSTARVTTGISFTVETYTAANDLSGFLSFLTRPNGVAATTLERMRITGAGNVGIGTSAPDALLSVNGIASFGAGAVATPSVAAFGDLNTGMWFPAADTVAWSTAGAERMRIRSDGNVGIGTSNPAYLLDVTGSARLGSNTVSSDPEVRLNSGTSDYTSFRRYSLGVSEIRQSSGTFQIVLEGGSPIILFTSNTERVRILSNGNVGIGTTAPDALLSVNGIASFGAGAAATPSLAAFGDLNTGMWFPAADTIAWSTNGAERVRIGSTGNVGIGTTTTTNLLNLYSATAAVASVAGDSVAGLVADRASNDANASFILFRKYRGTIAAPLAVASGDTAGSVQGSAYDGSTQRTIAQMFLSVETYNGANDLSSNIRFLTRPTGVGAALAERMRIDSNGNVGIGTSVLTGFSLRVFKNLTGSTAPSGVLSDGTIQSDATAIPTYFSAILRTAATSFTIGDAQIYRAATAALGAGSAVTRLYGYVAAELTAGTTNYGFFTGATAANVTAGKTYFGFIETSNIATGGGTSWAFYAQGTAPSYFNGQVQLGAGAVGTPSLAAFGDTNTGMWFPAADTIAWSTGGSERMRMDANGNVVVNTAAIATTATNGFLYVPSCAGTPTGTPTAFTGRVPIVVDTTNNKLYFYSGGAWRDAGP